MKIFFLSLLIILSSIFSAYAAELTVVAESNYQFTGIAATNSGRLFVNFPTWKFYPEFKVAELVNGELKAYPDPEINRQFICVQSVVTDEKGNLWIVDAAKLRHQGVNADGARIYKVNTKTNTVDHIYFIKYPAIVPNSYLNDIRIDTKSQFAYLTDSDAGGIVVLDLKNGDSWRAIDSTAPEVMNNLPGINFKSTGLWAKTGKSDGLELSSDKSILYFTALSGNILYKIPTSILRNKDLTVAERRKAISIENAHNVPTDGLLTVGNKLYMADLPNETVWEYDTKTHQGHDLEFPEAIRWADSFTTDRKGNIYFTTSQINYKDEERTTYKIYKLNMQQ